MNNQKLREGAMFFILEKCSYDFFIPNFIASYVHVSVIRLRRTNAQVCHFRTIFLLQNRTKK